MPAGLVVGVVVLPSQPHLSMFLPHPSSLLLPDVWFFIVQCPLEFAICWWHVDLFHSICWRPYHVECTGSLLTSEVKRHRAQLVLGWGTAWEDLRVLSAFSFSLLQCKHTMSPTKRCRLHGPSFHHKRENPFGFYLQTQHTLEPHPPTEIQTRLFAGSFTALVAFWIRVMECRGAVHVLHCCVDGLS